MNILFVDRDGVIQTRESMMLVHYNILQREGDRCFDPIASGYLHALLKDPNTEIVLTASSRDDVEFVEAVEAIIHRPVYSKTGHRSEKRGPEIVDWLRTNRHLYIESICILDDETIDMCELEKLRFCVKCTFESGLRHGQYTQACEILKNQKYLEIKSQVLVLYPNDSTNEK